MNMTCSKKRTKKEQLFVKTRLWKRGVKNRPKNDVFWPFSEFWVQVHEACWAWSKKVLLGQKNHQKITIFGSFLTPFSEKNTKKMTFLRSFLVIFSSQKCHFWQFTRAICLVFENHWFWGLTQNETQKWPFFDPFLSLFGPFLSLFCHFPYIHRGTSWNGGPKSTLFGPYLDPIWPYLDPILDPILDPFFDTPLFRSSLEITVKMT